MRNNTNRSILKRLEREPKTLFLIDGLGALTTGVILFAVSRWFYDYFGMPQLAITWLSILAVVFCFYSFFCFFFLKGNWSFYLLIIACANLLYIALTITLCICFSNSITLLGLAYFAAEVIVISMLVFIELKSITLRQEGS